MTPVLADRLPDLAGAPVPEKPPRLRALARYQLAGVTRVLCRPVAKDRTALFDMPGDHFDAGKQPTRANGSYLVEPDLGGDRKELRALVLDYLQQVALHQRVPMAASALEDVPDTSPL